MPLYGHEHEGNRAATECIGGNFNEVITSLSMLLHLCGMGYQYSTLSSIDNIIILTLQTNKRGMSVKACQITLIENGFYLIVEVHFSITAFIL